MASQLPISRSALAVPGPSSRTLRVLALAIVLLTSLAVFTATADAATKKKKKHKPPVVTIKTPITRGSRYLALGDSVTFGYQEDGVVPTPDYHDASSFVGYPELIGTARAARTRATARRSRCMSVTRARRSTSRCPT
jgi:hypothetical protein